METFDRSQRVSAALRRALSEIFRTQVRDPRVGNLTIQEVRVSRDLSHAKVYFTCFLQETDPRMQEKLLNGALRGFLRRQLAQRIALRAAPQLRFVYDESIAYGDRLTRLIDASNPD